MDGLIMDKKKLSRLAKQQPREPGTNKYVKVTDVCVSNCCDAKIRVEGKVTKWHICTKCGKPCNWRDGRI